MNATFLPRVIKRIRVPPIKCQGIKTQLVPFIAANIEWQGEGRWIEPFLGSGVVAFNIAPKRAKLTDANRHMIELYRSIRDGLITEGIVRERLIEMGGQLRADGDGYFYEVRTRFNATGDPLDLLFLNRSCFNGVMRFNSKGKYNVPFGKKTGRFSKTYITKIVNQVHWLRCVLQENDWQIECADWKTCLADARPDDFVYLDPPYIGRHTDYYSRWEQHDAEELARTCHALPCGFALSMWKCNRYRENDHLATWWTNEEIRTFSHFYHVGSTESLRNEMTEALAIARSFGAAADFWEERLSSVKRRKDAQFSLFDEPAEGANLI